MYFCRDPAKAACAVCTSAHGAVCTDRIGSLVGFRGVPLPELVGFPPYGVSEFRPLRSSRPSFCPAMPERV